MEYISIINTLDLMFYLNFVVQLHFFKILFSFFFLNSHACVLSYGPNDNVGVEIRAIWNT